MITQIEIDGFKTFKDFKVELAPFQVIVGPNGSGKSNLFDALHLLSRLATDDIASAFQVLRGRDYEQFTALPNGKYTDRIRIAVEMLVDRKVQDDLGDHAELTYTRLRYQLEVSIRTNGRGMERFYVTHESLAPIFQEEDNWSEKYGISSQESWIPKLTVEEQHYKKLGQAELLIHTINVSDNSEGHTLITLFSERPIENKDSSRRFKAESMQRTVLSSVNDISYYHAFAAREELRSLKFLHLNPKALREPSSVKAPKNLSSDGGNLPTTLARMQAEDKFALKDVSRDMANLVPGILDIEIDEDKARAQYIVQAKTANQRTFSSQVLSDGTLRLLALATLGNDPQFHGILCLEEPENGVHPFGLKNMARLLRKMATDFNDPEQVNEPLRQVLVTTHSPAFISQPGVLNQGRSKLHT